MRKAAANQVTIVETSETERFRNMSKKAKKVVEFPDEKQFEMNDYVMDENPYVCKLRFELVEPFYSGAAPIQLKPNEKKLFLKNAKAKEGIIREVWVPGNMTLHTMHYMIQRLFGWQNSHLHNYSLSEKDFNDVTDGQKVKEYQYLSGTIFNFPGGKMEDRFWDDDYKEGISFRSWLKNKYCGSAVDLSVETTYIRNQERAKRFQKRFSKKLKNKEDLTIRELEECIGFEDDFNFILERISVSEIFRKCLSQEMQLSFAETKKMQQILIDLLENELKYFKKKEKKDYDEMNLAMENLLYLRGSILSIKRAIRFGDEDRIRDFYGQDPEKEIAEEKEMVNELEKMLGSILSFINPVVYPFTDELYYNYDYGDSWCVKITCEDAYVANDATSCDELKFTDGQAKEVDEALKSTLCNVYLNKTPVCVMADGLNVMDDVGGIYGYIDFLNTINSQEPDDDGEKESSLRWAKGMGWTGRKTRPEKIL